MHPKLQRQASLICLAIFCIAWSVASKRCHKPKAFAALCVRWKGSVQHYWTSGICRHHVMMPDLPGCLVDVTGELWAPCLGIWADGIKLSGFLMSVHHAREDLVESVFCMGKRALACASSSNVAVSFKEPSSMYGWATSWVIMSFGHVGCDSMINWTWVNPGPPSRSVSSISTPAKSYTQLHTLTGCQSEGLYVLQTSTKPQSLDRLCKCADSFSKPWFDAEGNALRRGFIFEFPAVGRPSSQILQRPVWQALAILTGLKCLYASFTRLCSFNCKPIIWIACSLSAIGCSNSKPRPQLIMHLFIAQFSDVMSIHPFELVCVKDCCHLETK